MRVATIFTGVAAAAVGMTQAANAQDAAPAAYQPTPRHLVRQMRPAESKFGSIRSSAFCAIADVGHPAHDFTWLHLYWWDASLATSNSVCYGFAGWIVSPPGRGVTYECGGNNHGELRGFSKGKSWHFDFGPGTTYAHLNKASLDVVSIWSWTGTDKCPRL